jgi:lon-related putative ATP-dependent protease
MLCVFVESLYMPLTPLTLEQLRRVSDPASFKFNTTAELSVAPEIIGQPRGTRAIEFGIDIDSPGYNIFVLGEEGTGRTTAIGRFLRNKAEHRPRPQDWMYVQNFTEPHRPRALNLPAGLGSTLRDDMNGLVEHLKRSLPQAFEQETYLAEYNKIQNQFESDRDTMFATLAEKALALNITVVNTASGIAIAPIHNGKPLSPEEFESLPELEQKELEAAREQIKDEMESMLRVIRNAEKATREAQRQLNQNVAASVVDRHLDELRTKYSAHSETVFYLNEVRQDIVEHVTDFLPSDDSKGDAATQSRPDFRRYTVNLVVDHSKTQGAPVIVELNPTFAKLLGRIENESRFGMLLTDFTLIKTGALHAANGGYLVLRARDVFYEPLAWDALKRSMISGYVRTEDITSRTGFGATKTLDPEPIPLDLKVVLVGSPDIYYDLLHLDEDFGTIFKVKADFVSEMPRTSENELQYAQFVATRCAEEKLLPFDRGAVAKVIEYGSRLIGDQYKLSVRLGEIADLLREANYWAGMARHDVVGVDDVLKALEEKFYRHNKSEEILRERILEGSVYIDTNGSVVGQVNALSIVDYGDHNFGIPSRVTARTFVGHGGISQIDRDTNMTGPIHNKGLLTLISYFNSTYATHRSLSFSAQITFEQNYNGIEGDSASCAELCALLSSLSAHPIKQSIAITGAVNQKGDILPIGGVNEKVEGFFTVCHARGLTGDQGVIIPQTNVRDLMLRENVLEAVKENKFYIYSVSTVSEAIEILTGVPAGERKDNKFPDKTVHHAAEKRLRELARGHDRDEDDKKPRKKKRAVKRKPIRRRKR